MDFNISRIELYCIITAYIKCLTCNDLFLRHSKNVHEYNLKSKLILFQFCINRLTKAQLPFHEKISFDNSERTIDASGHDPSIS